MKKKLQWVLDTKMWPKGLGPPEREKGQRRRLDKGAGARSHWREFGLDPEGSRSHGRSLKQAG